METKVCNKCGKELNIESFGKNEHSKDGLLSSCKICTSIYRKEYKKKNKDKLKIQDKLYKEKYRPKNREKQRKYSKKYYEKNVDKILEEKKKYRIENSVKISQNRILFSFNNPDYQKQYYKNNNSRILTYYKKYYEINNISLRHRVSEYAKNNKDKRNIISQRYRAKKLLLPHTFTINQWSEAKIYFNNKCCYCGTELPLTQEHFIAVNNKGGYVKENIIPSCQTCNSSKGDVLFEDWYPKYKYYDEEREQYILDYLKLQKEII